MAVNRFGSSQEHAEGAASPEGTRARVSEEVNGHSKGPAAFGRLQRQLDELREYAQYYLAARASAITASMRRMAMLAVAGLLGLMILGAALMTATVIGVLGIAYLIADALDGRLWAGFLITGFGLLLLVGIATWLAMSIMKRSSRKRTQHDYARRREEQRARFGYDVAQRAEEARESGRA